MSGDEYTKNLENIIKQILTPLKGLPFNLIVEAISGCRVDKFDGSDSSHNELLEKIKSAVIRCCNEVNKKGILRPRPNEVGNDIESFLRGALDMEKGFNSQIPKALSGKHRNAGYPDIELNYDENICYIECKTYNIANIDTTQRSFYFSPSSDFKICNDGLHIIVSFEVYVSQRSKGMNLYKTKGWKILDAYGLQCDVKYEFNADNKRLYAEKMILAEGLVAD